MMLRDLLFAIGVVGTLTGAFFLGISVGSHQQIRQYDLVVVDAQGDAYVVDYDVAKDDCPKHPDARFYCEPR